MLGHHTQDVANNLYDLCRVSCPVICLGDGYGLSYKIRHHVAPLLSPLGSRLGFLHAWSALSFPLEQRWADKVGILEEARYPVTLEYCVEELSDKHDKEQLEAWVKEFGVKRIADIASNHAHVKEGVKNKDPYFETLYEMDLTPESVLVVSFGICV